MDRGTKGKMEGAALGVIAGAALGAAGMYAADKHPRQVKKALKKAGKDRAWLQKQMQAAGFRDEREILLAVAGAGDRVTFYKNEA